MTIFFNPTKVCAVVPATWVAICKVIKENVFFTTCLPRFSPQLVHSYQDCELSDLVMMGQYAQ